MPNVSEKIAVQKKETAKPKAVPKVNFAGMTNSALKKVLLAKPTIADSAWAPYRNASPRNEGETRSEYIKRVLSP